MSDLITKLVFWGQNAILTSLFCHIQTCLVSFKQTKKNDICNSRLTWSQGVHLQTKDFIPWTKCEMNIKQIVDRRPWWQCLCFVLWWWESEEVMWNKRQSNRCLQILTVVSMPCSPLLTTVVGRVPTIYNSEVNAKLTTDVDLHGNIYALFSCAFSDERGVCLWLL